jgi:5-methylcytosine-specific restriction enzyme A
MTKRRLSRKAKDAVIERYGGRCARCGTGGVELHVDHVIPIWTSGREDDANLQPLCKTCHSAKTRTDVRTIAKIKRQAAKHNGTTRPRKWSRKIRNGGFNKTLRRKMNGEVVPNTDRARMK